MPGAPELRVTNPLKKLVADTVFNAAFGELVKLDGPNIEDVTIRRVSDLRTEVTISRRFNSGNRPPDQFTIQVIEHQ
jgi:hypothetical protein